MGLDFVDLKLRVEQSFGVTLEPEDYGGIPRPGGSWAEPKTKVGDLLEIVLRKRRQLAREGDAASLRELAIADVRRALVAILQRSDAAIEPEDGLAGLLDKRRRRAVWRELRRRLGKRLPTLEWDVLSERVVWWSCCLVLTAAAAAAGVYWAVIEAESTVSLVFSIVVVSACAFMPGAIGATLFVSLPWWLRRRLPPHVVSVADLGAAVLALNRDRYVQQHGDPGDEDVWPSLRILVADVLGVPVERVTPEADLDPRPGSQLGRGDHFAADQVVRRLPAADQVGLAVADQHFGGQRLGVVVRAHHEAVGSGALDHQVVAHARPRAARGWQTKPPSSWVKMSPDSHSGPPTITSMQRRDSVLPSAGDDRHRMIRRRRGSAGPGC